jgi:hypothetical protein
VITRTISTTVIGAANTTIARVLDSPASVAWTSHWLITVLDSGTRYDVYAAEISAAGRGRGSIKIVECGVLCDRVAAEAIRGSSFALSSFSELYLFGAFPEQLPPRLPGRTTASVDFEEPDEDALVAKDLENLGAFAFFGDGDWLNFATTSRDLLAEIQAAEARQGRR